MSAPDYAREPWKHPAVWKSHVVTMTRQYLCKVETSVATCECGWAACAKLSNYRSQDSAINGHWHNVIAEAEAALA